MRLRILRSAEETRGELLEMEAAYVPDGTEPPEHLHPRQEERFEVLAGTLRVRLPDGVRTLAAGEAVMVPPGTPHAMWNPGPGEARVRWETRPALGTERFFETFFALARAGRTDARGVPGLLQLAVLVPAFREEIRLTKPPAAVQRVVFGALAPLARALGYRAAPPPA
ncbi:MAG TPA: cupin domain-containing protein [Longimicrobiaceae bacterium]|nr:cupin domain-containing protein [Longimicrobiaceae bacterium]